MHLITNLLAYAVKLEPHPGGAVGPHRTFMRPANVEESWRACCTTFVVNRSGGELVPSREALEYRVVSDHIALRGLLTRVESVASQIVRGECRLLGVLLTEARALIDTLETHNTWETAELLQQLRASGPLGEQRASYLQDDHGTQLAMLRRAVDSLEAQDRSFALLAREMIELTMQLRNDLADEEDMILDDKLMERSDNEGGEPEGSL